MSTTVSDNLKKYRVSVLGESYNLVSDESPEHLDMVTYLVDSSMREISQKCSISDYKKVAVLVALQFASRTLSAKQEHDKEQQSYDKLIDLIDREISHIGML